MRHRDAGEPLVARVEEQEGALGKLAGGRTGQGLMQRIELGQRLLVDQSVATGERLGRRTAAVAQVVLGAKLLDQPLHLRA